MVAPDSIPVTRRASQAGCHWSGVQCYRFHARAFGKNNGLGKIRHNKPLHRTPTPAFFPAFCVESFLHLTSHTPHWVVAREFCDGWRTACYTPIEMLRLVDQNPLSQEMRLNEKAKVSQSQLISFLHSIFTVMPFLF